jgi:glycosyltransferase involved in cell wall biosynthesis
MDILFNPSVTETFGNVTLEAMAAGRPVVAAIATGSQSLVEDGVTGRLVRAGAIEGFAAALEAYCRDRALREAAGRAGCAASLRYGWDQVNQALVDSYVRIIRQRAAAARPRLPDAAP